MTRTNGKLTPLATKFYHNAKGVKKRLDDPSDTLDISESTSRTDRKFRVIGLDDGPGDVQRLVQVLDEADRPARHEAELDVVPVVVRLVLDDRPPLQRAAAAGLLAGLTRVLAAGVVGVDLLALVPVAVLVGVLLVGAELLLLAEACTLPPAQTRRECRSTWCQCGTFREHLDRRLSKDG